MNSNKNFDKWNAIKKNIENDQSESGRFPKQGEVWVASLGKNIGVEQNGGINFSRPVLIIKKFNNQMFWTVPLSTKQKKFDFYYNFENKEGEKISVILAQMKLMSVKRLKREIYGINQNEFIKIKNKLKKFLN